MKSSAEGKRLFENTLSLPMQENKSVDEKSLIFGGSERKEIKIPNSSNDGIQLGLSIKESRQDSIKPITTSIRNVSFQKTKANDEAEKCLLI